MNLYLDDCRSAPDGYKLVKTARECIDVLRSVQVEHLSLDHDLGDACEKCWRQDELNELFTKSCVTGCKCDCHGTGYEVCLWMAEHDVWPTHKPQVHSANPVGAANMRSVIERYWPHRVERPRRPA